MKIVQITGKTMCLYCLVDCRKFLVKCLSESQLVPFFSLSFVSEMKGLISGEICHFPNEVKWLDEGDSWPHHVLEAPCSTLCFPDSIQSPRHHLGFFAAGIEMYRNMLILLPTGLSGWFLAVDAKGRSPPRGCAFLVAPAQTSQCPCTQFPKFSCMLCKLCWI